MMFHPQIKRSVIAVVLLLLLACIASAGCTVKWPFQSATTSPQPTGTTSGTAHTLSVWTRTFSDGSVQYDGGSTDTVQVTTSPGNGQVFVTTSPLLGFDYTESARTAVDVAAKKANVDPKLYNFQFTIIYTSVNVSREDGPSAGAALTIATYSAITKKPTNPYVYETGTINPDGTIGTVGGVYWKGIAAAQAGAKVLLVPPTQSYVNKDPNQRGVGGANLQQELKQKGFDVRVVEVHNIDEAMPYYFS